MNVVWDTSSATVRDVLEKVEDHTGWAYTTVKTILTRLVERTLFACASEQTPAFMTLV